MQTAATIDAMNLQFYWVPDSNDTSTPYYAVMYFAELVRLGPKDVRLFNIEINGNYFYPSLFSPVYLLTTAISGYVQGSQQYTVLILQADNSTLYPMMNAMEIFMLIPIGNLATDFRDIAAITAIKAQYQITRNWMGDPCGPKTFIWQGLNCGYGISDPPRITALNLSSSGLSGQITTAFASLTALQSLDLSHNSLTGRIPDILGQLPSLVFLDLTGNQLDGSVPASLLKKSHDGSLTLRIGDNTNICANATSCASTKNNNTDTNSSSTPSSTSTPTITDKSSSSTHTIVIVPIIVVVLLLISLIIGALCMTRRRQDYHRGSSVRPQNENYSGMKESEVGFLQLENRQFTYKDLKTITSNFQQVIGKGGFGSVYTGFLEDGTPVAVKMLSQSSTQGVKEFMAEVQHLTRVHHKNLVGMIGYCKDAESLALVYEFMSEGTLDGKLRGKASNARPLTWRIRLQIALDSAQGLEYLHKACKPPLIHRDVKSNNILLTSKLEAKIADFGLSKAFNSDLHTHISTAVVGTPGYLDPEYYTSFQLSEKSDVYSFGVVLLEIVTGQPSILPENIHIVQWVRQRLAKGNIESVIDVTMQEDHDVNSVWKVVDVALQCTEHASSQRPTMTDVVTQLKESLELEGTREALHNSYPASSNQYSRSDDFYSAANDSQNSAVELEQVGRVDFVSGPAAR